MDKRIFTKDLLGARITVATACVYVVAMAVTAWMTVNETAEQSRLTAKNALATVSARVNGAVMTVESATRSNVWMIEENASDPEFMLHLTGQFVASHERLMGSIVAFREDFYKSKGKYYAPYSSRDENTGVVESKVVGSDKYDYFGMDWYCNPLEEGKPCWCEPYFDKGAGNVLMTTYSIPLFDKDGKMYAVHTADVSLGRLKSDLEAIRPFENSYTLVMTAAGRSITSVYDTGILSFMQKMNKGDEGMSKFISDDGDRYTVVYGPLANGWSAAIVCPDSDIYRSVWVICGWMFLIFVIGLGVLFLIDRRLIRIFASQKDA